MLGIYIPDKIREVTDSMTPQVDSTGRSSSAVIKFCDKERELFLKIGEHGFELQRELDAISWLTKKVPVPKIVAKHIENGKVYLLIERVQGERSCDDSQLNSPENMVCALADGIKQLQAVDITDCPCDSTIDIMLAQAKKRIQTNQISIDNLQMKTGYRLPMELYEYLEDNKPDEDLVFSHGDFCLPNIFISGKKTVGYIDLGRAGVSDKWVDIAICIRSLAYNLGTDEYTNMFLSEIGIEPDYEKIRYFTLLDEI